MQDNTVDASLGPSSLLVFYGRKPLPSLLSDAGTWESGMMYMAFSISAFTARSQRGSCRSDQCEIIVRVDSDRKVRTGEIISQLFPRTDLRPAIRANTDI